MANATRLLIKNGTLIDGSGGGPAPNRLLVVEENRITLVGETDGSIRLDIPDDTLRKRLGKKANETFEQLLKDYHRELDMFEVYFPGVRIIGVDANGTPQKVAKRVKKALAEVPPVKSPS